MFSKSVNLWLLSWFLLFESQVYKLRSLEGKSQIEISPSNSTTTLRRRVPARTGESGTSTNEKFWERHETPRYYRKRGRLYVRRHASESELKDLRKAVEADPNDIRNRYSFGVASLIQGNYNDAIENLETVRTLAEETAVPKDEIEEVTSLLQTARENKDAEDEYNAIYGTTFEKEKWE